MVLKQVLDKEANIDTDFTFFTKLNPTWTKGLKVKGKTIKLLSNNIGEKI